MNSRVARYVLLLLGLALLAGCQFGATCTSQSCPEGHSCVEGSCVASPDVGATDGGGGGGGGGPSDGGSCGDAVVAGTEACDDGNSTSSDGCSALCAIEPNYSCPVAGQPCVVGAVCGDGRLSGKEQCDDRNTTSSDGCSATCALEAGWACPNVGVACVAAACGDGKLAGLEECDDGNASSGDGCSTTCVLEDGSACPTPGLACHATVCGDTVIEGTEQCDDGDHDLGDGCDTTCRLEPRCTNGVCTPVCGDGVRLPQEACDDGNTRSGDGCADTCEIEAGFTCGDAVLALPDTLAIPIVYRDFLPWGTDGGHVDFDHIFSPSEKGIVAAHLGADDKPVYGNQPRTLTTHGAAAFDAWYHDAPGVNRTEVDKLVVARTAPDTYVFDSQAFFPLDGRGWQRDGTEASRHEHNFNFTSELRYWFTYSGGEVLTFIGDDDVFVFINGHLAVDLGGIHSAETGTVTLDANAAADAGLVDGGIYEAAVFQAERHVVGSNYKLTLKGFNAPKSGCQWRCGDGVVTRYEACDDGVNDGGYGGCMPGCVTRGPYCGDGHVDSAFGEGCDDGVNIGTYGACAPGCRSPARCGDGVVQHDAGEECDDGNRVSDDGCDDVCHVEIE